MVLSVKKRLMLEYTLFESIRELLTDVRDIVYSYRKLIGSLFMDSDHVGNTPVIWDPI
jgi:hypothetical protein